MSELQDWQKRFKEQVEHHDGVMGEYCYSKEVEAFIQAERTKAKEEAIEEMEYAVFTKTAILVYGMRNRLSNNIDEMIRELDELKQSLTEKGTDE